MNVIVHSMHEVVENKVFSFKLATTTIQMPGKCNSALSYRSIVSVNIIEHSSRNIYSLHSEEFYLHPENLVDPARPKRLIQSWTLYQSPYIR